MTATLDTQALKQLDQAHHLHPLRILRTTHSMVDALSVEPSTSTSMIPMATRFRMACQACGAATWATVRIESRGVTQQLAELPFTTTFFKCSNQPAAGWRACVR
ncbi:MAG: hypothetical protein CM15mP74_36120 [Halieaceae bacterium]|nr:MAG: hypothetical protein CM15mP74_36120 [Halieaceae bacterium]